MQDGQLAGKLEIMPSRKTASPLASWPECHTASKTSFQRYSMSSDQLSGMTACQVAGNNACQHAGKRAIAGR
jgi:hypothetical protein